MKLRRWHCGQLGEQALGVDVDERGTFYMSAYGGWIERRRTGDAAWTAFEGRVGDHQVRANGIVFADRLYIQGTGKLWTVVHGRVVPVDLPAGFGPDWEVASVGLDHLQRLWVTLRHGELEEALLTTAPGVPGPASL